ncbi:MAG: heavy metal-binding domain-containing protein [Fibrobacterota bacterium]
MAVYTCPMHPEVISDTPSKCPKCGMNLIKKQ